MKPRSVGLLNLLVVYFVWGSTFLAIRLAVQGEGAIRPFSLAVLRVGIAGITLLLWSVLRGYNLKIENGVLVRLAISGVLFWVGGHALLLWVAQWADSGFSALIFASIPLWIVLIEGARSPASLTRNSLLPVISGFIGILVLSIPQISSSPNDSQNAVGILGTLVLLGSSLCWSIGTTLHDKSIEKIPISVSAGYQQVFAAIVCTLCAALAGEFNAPPPVSKQALWALSYLTLIGSVLAFSSYAVALKLLPKNLVASFAYVNPIIAVALGYWFLGEQITMWTLCGMTLVILSVIWLFHNNSKQGAGNV